MCSFVKIAGVDLGEKAARFVVCIQDLVNQVNVANAVLLGGSFSSDLYERCLFTLP